MRARRRRSNEIAHLRVIYEGRILINRRRIEFGWLTCRLIQTVACRTHVARVRFVKSARPATLLLCFCLGAACTDGPYHYNRSDQGAADNGAHQANDLVHDIPGINPVGKLRVRYFGIEGNRPPGGPATKTIHIVLVVTNQSSAATWEMDSKDQIVSFPNGMLARAASASPEYSHRAGRKSRNGALHSLSKRA